MLQTIQKIGPVLDLFTVERPEWGVSEVAAAISVPRSSAHALLSSLVETGLLQSKGRGRYRIGWRVVELSETLRGTVNVRSVARPVLERLVRDYGETSHLAVMERSRVLYVDKILGTHQVNVTGARVGAQLEPHCSAVGKALLAHLSDEEIKRILGGQPMRRLTSTTITDPKTLFAELIAVRKVGVAYDVGEAVPDVQCVAAPVRDEMGVVVAAVSVTVPANRFTRSKLEFTAAVKAAAADISARLADAEDTPAEPLLDDPFAGAERR
jgi:DNA-binding IclR family transcriptional regulator